MANNVINGGLGYKGERGFSPTIDVTKTSGVATITINDIDGTKTTTISDGEITKAMVVDNLTTTTTDVPLSAKQGKVLNDKIDNLITIVSGEANWEQVGETTYKEFSIIIPYPTGFNINNTFIVSEMYWGILFGEFLNANYEPLGHIETFVGENGIHVQGKANGIGDDVAKVRVAIMKTTINPWA